VCLRTARSASPCSAKQLPATRPNVYPTHVPKDKGSVKRPRIGTGCRNMDSEPASVGADAFSVGNGCLTACGTKKDPAPGSRHCFTTARHQHQLHNAILPAVGILRLLYAPFSFYCAQCVGPCRIVRLFAAAFVRQEVVGRAPNERPW
jgi:hypothetical protein